MRRLRVASPSVRREVTAVGATSSCACVLPPSIGLGRPSLLPAYGIGPRPHRAAFSIPPDTPAGPRASVAHSSSKQRQKPRPAQSSSRNLDVLAASDGVLRRSYSNGGREHVARRVAPRHSSSIARITYPRHNQTLPLPSSHDTMGMRQTRWAPHLPHGLWGSTPTPDSCETSLNLSGCGTASAPPDTIGRPPPPPSSARRNITTTTAPHPPHPRHPSPLPPHPPPKPAAGHDQPARHDRHHAKQHPKMRGPRFSCSSTGPRWLPRVAAFPSAGVASSSSSSSTARHSLRCRRRLGGCVTLLTSVAMWRSHRLGCSGGANFLRGSEPRVSVL